MARTKQTARIGRTNPSQRKHLPSKLPRTLTKQHHHLPRTLTKQHQHLPIGDVITERAALKCPQRIALMTNLLKGTAVPHITACAINDYLLNKVFTDNNGTPRDFANEYNAMAQFIGSTNKPTFHDPLPAETMGIADVLAHKDKLLRARKGSDVTFVTTKSRQQVVDESMAFGQSFSAKGQRGVSQN
jgi:hypothetical protein